MDNQYEIIARDGDQVIERYDITSGGSSTSIGAQNDVLYEVVEPSTGVAPQQVMFKRVDDTLEIRLGGTTANSPADVVIEDYFQLDNPPQFIGLAEDGQYYYFVPQSGLTEDFLESLDDEDVTFQSLGYDTVEEQTIWWPMVLGGVALAGLGALALGGGGGSGGSDNDDVLPDSGGTQSPNVDIYDLETNDSTPALNGTVDDATASVVVTINGVDYPAVNNGDGTWTLEDNTVSELAEGEYVVTVTATDSAGNSDTASGTVIIDLTAPDAPTINPSDGSELSGSAEPGSEIQIDVDGDGNTDYTTVTDETGSWSITLDPALDDGTEVSVTATDNAGNDSDPSVSTIDAQAPNVLINDVLTNDPTPALTGTVDDPTATIIVSLGGEQYTATNNGDGTWILADNTLPELADGSYSVAVEATDEAGNQSRADGQLEVDSTAPDAPQINDTNGSELTGNAEPGSRIDVDVNGDGTTDYTTTTDGNGQWSITPDTPLADGTEVTATATDGAGNASDPSLAVVDSSAANVSVYNLITNDPTPELSGLVDIADATVVVNVNGIDYVVTNQGDGTWTLVDNTLPELVDGTYNVSVTATTPTGVVSLGSGTVVIDTTPPASPLIDASDGTEITGTAEAGSEIQVDVDGDGTPDYTTVADENGDWSITPDAPLADGTVITATATDDAGNVSDPSSAEVDARAPVVSINDALTNDATPELTGLVDDPTASITVTVDGNDYTTTNNGDGTWTLADDTLPELTDNSYTVKVTATDEAGNQSTATGTLVVDTVAPDAPIINAGNGEEISGTAEANSVVNIDVNGDGTPDYATTADENGNWSVTPDSPLLDGTEIDATATDQAGNTSESASSTTNAAAATVTVTSDVTNDSTPPLAGTIDDPSATVVVNVNGIDYPAVNNGDGTWTISDDTLPSLVDGSYSVVVTATTDLGAISTANGTLTIDATAPAVTVNDVASNDTTPALTGTVDDNTASVTVNVNGTDYLATNNGDGTWTLADDTLPPLNENSYTVTVTATDEAGNQGTATGTLVVDTTAPSAGDGFNSIMFNDGGDELLSQDEAVSVSLSGEVEDGAIINSITISDGTTDISIPAANISIVGGVVTVSDLDLSGLNDGLLTVTMEVTDEAGNTGTVTDTTTLDATPPVVSVDEVLTNDATPALTGTVDDTAASVTVNVNGTDYPATNNGDGTWTLADDTLPALTENSYTVTVTATDEAGNQSTSTGTLVVDTTAPVVTVDDALTNDATPALTGSVDDPAANVIVTVNGTDYPATNNGDGTWTLADDTLPALADNSYPVTVTATDEAGNQGTATSTLVVDTVAPDAPVINAGNGTEISGTAEANSEVNIDVDGDGTPDYTTTADENGNWAVTPDSPLADGTEVKATATDQAGNTSEPASSTTNAAAATVTVNSAVTNDSTPPLSGTIDDSAATVVVNVNGTDYTAINNGDGTWSIGDNVVTELAEGNYPILVTATTLTGAESTASGSLTIDTTAPAVTVDDVTTNDTTPALTGTVDDNTASVSVNVNGTDYPATNNGDGTWTLADDTLPPLTENSYTVTVNATDEAGNQDTATGTLVIDTGAPSNGDGLNSITFNDGGDELLNADESASVSLSGTVETGATINSIIISDGTTDISVPAANISVDGAGVVTVSSLNLSSLNDGLLTVTMEVTDQAGNTGTVTDTTTLDTSIDGVASEPIVSFDGITTDSGTDGDFITSDTTLILNGTVNTSETTQLTVGVSGTVYTQGVSPELNVDASGNWTLDLTGSALSAGTYTVVATVTDAAGNSESSAPQNVLIQALDAIADNGSLDLGEPTVTVGAPQTTQDVQVIGVAESTGGADASSAFSVSADHVGEVTVEVSQKSLVAVADAYKVEVYNASNELVYASVSANSQLADVGGLNIFNVTGDETISFSVDGLPAGDYTVVVRNDESQLEDLLDSDGSNDVNLTELGDAGVVLGPDNQDSVLNTVEGTLGVVLGPAVRGILETALDTTTEIGAGELVDILTQGLTDLGLLTDLDIVLSAVADALLSNTLTVLQDTDITTTVTEYVYDGVTEAQGNLITGDSGGVGEDTIVAGSLITAVENATGQSAVVNATGITTIEGKFGTLEIESDGSYRYVANGDRASIGQNDVFTYTLSDGETSDTATLTISISGSDFTAASAQSDSIDMALGAQTSQVSEPVTVSDMQVVGVLESASSEPVVMASMSTASTSSITSTPIVVGDGFNGEVVVEVSQEALLAVADAYVVEIVDAQGQVVGQAVTEDNPLVGDVAGLTVLGLTGDDTLVANFSGLPAGEYTVVVRNDESELANLFDTSGDSNISLTELGAGGVVLGAENQDALLDAIESALNGSVLGSAGGLDVGSAVRTFILEPLLATVDSIGAGDLVDTLTTGLNTIGLTSVVDEVLDIVADTLLSNTLTLLQQTDVTSTLTEYQFEGSTTVSGNVIQGGGAGEVADSLVNGGVVTQVTNTDGDIVTVLGSGTSGVTLTGKYGDLTVYENGSYTYVANGARAGLGDSDSFTYTISDGFSSDSANLTFNLTGQGAASDTATAELHYDYVSVVVPPVNDALDVSWLVSLLGSIESDTYNVEVAANTTQDLSFTLSNVDLLALGSSVTLTLSQDVDGTMTEVESFSDDALLTLLSGNSNQVVFDGLTEGSYEVTLTVDVPLGVAGSVSADLTQTISYLDQYAVDEVSIAEGNLFTNDVQFGTDYTLSISDDGVTFQTVTTSSTLVGQYGTLSVDVQGKYSYTPDSDLAVFGGTLNDTFSYRVEYPDGTVEQTELDVFITATGEGVPEPVTMMQAMLSYTSEDDVDLAFSESSDAQTVPLASSDSDGVMIEGVMFSDAGTMTQPLTIEDESNVVY
ncbi:Ig-like domain-containing protein [Vibrio sp. J1-1]|uniref:BapA/Bap/LapF family large adhesin n=1 Tax=Vibrio sp. J1-1 TaxID=2912251 RepID=UPI001F4707CA|nr:BapA/Bap/LapF family large adhesin [Vibrio sp. J1-1]MCF7480996.1 Ig-like domain-containing protein [Vibrio sp. J1-1]